MFEPTADEIEQTNVRVQERIAIRAAARLPVLDHEATVAHALSLLAAEKEQVVYAHWVCRLWARWHRRVERRIERNLGRPFRFNSISGYAVHRRWLSVLSRFIRIDVERRFGLSQAVSLADVRRAYRDKHRA